MNMIRARGTLGANVTDGINVINFDSLFSGTAVGTPRMASARLRFTS